MNLTTFSPQTHKHIIYQLVLRWFSNTKTKNKPFGTVKENGCGKFNDINERVLKSLKEFGVTHIWYTGVLEHSTMTAYPEINQPADDPRIVKGRAGSPYAVRDYYDVDPDLAVDIPNRMAEFEAMISRTKSAGLKSIIDFIPNHVARSYQSDMNPGNIPDFGTSDDKTVLFHPDNNFLYLSGESFVPPSDYQPLGGMKIPATQLNFVEFPAKVTGNDVYSAYPSSNDWFETIKLNFGVDPHPPHTCFFDPVPRTWQKLLDILLYWAKKGVDGFRCDMAEMVPAEFWEWVIPCVKTHFPDVLFIAEIYKPELYERYLEKGYFDYLYDKVRLYDTLGGVIRGHTAADELTHCARSVEKFPEKMLSFMENHDEERLASSFFAGDGFAGVPAMYVSALLSKGPVMVYAGQETGEDAAENVGFAGLRGRTSIFDYCSVPSLQKWYNKGKCNGALLSEEQQLLRTQYAELLNFASTHDAIINGGFYDLQYINRHHQSEGYDERYVYSFIRHTAGEKLLILVNFNRTSAYDLHLRIPAEALRHIGLSGKKEIHYKGLLNTTIEGAITPSKLYVEHDRFSGLPLRLEPNSAYVISMY